MLFSNYFFFLEIIGSDSRYLSSFFGSVIMALEFLQDFRPTIDRPFGIKLWPIFDKAFEYVMGYPASQFEFARGVTPMSTIQETGIMLVAYYIIVFGGREFMKSRPALKLNTLFMIHNLYLTMISGTLLALFIEQLLPTIWRHGIFYAICDYQGGWTQPLIVIYYVSGLDWSNSDKFKPYGTCQANVILA